MLTVMSASGDSCNNCTRSAIQTTTGINAHYLMETINIDAEGCRWIALTCSTKSHPNTKYIANLTVNQFDEENFQWVSKGVQTLRASSLKLEKFFKNLTNSKNSGSFASVTKWG